MSEITQKDSDRLADVIWFLIGYVAAFRDIPLANCTFQDDHVESLKKARIEIQRIINEKEDTK